MKKQRITLTGVRKLELLHICSSVSLEMKKFVDELREEEELNSDVVAKFIGLQVASIITISDVISELIREGKL